MILVLSRDPTLRNPLQKWLDRSVIREREVQGESIMLLHPGMKTDWQKTAQKLGRYASRVICPQSIELPKERPWRRMDCTKVKEKLLTNTLCSYSDRLEWVGVYDPDGRHTMMVWELAQHFPRVTVWCSFRERYASVSEELMEQLGAAPELTCNWEGFMGCPLIAAMEAPEFRLRWDGEMLLSGSCDVPPLMGTLRQNLRLEVPQEWREICPCDLDPQELYLAFLQESRKAIPKDLHYQTDIAPEDAGEIEKFL